MAILPREISSLRTKRRGVTLTEVMIVVAIIAILILIAIWSYRPQLLKGRDARRKADLNRLEKVFEDYYNDNDCYPQNPGDLADYLSEFPKDPVTREAYEFSTNDCDVYRIYAKLEYEQDPAIAEAGCSSGCGPGGGTEGGTCTYNYGVCSPNVGLEACAEEECTGWYACQVVGAETTCNATEEESDLWPKYCDPCCEGNCPGPESCP